MSEKKRTPQMGTLAAVLLLVGMLLGALPGTGYAQTVTIGTCWVCEFSSFPDSEWPSWMCAGKLKGKAKCKQWGNKHQHFCDAHGASCDVEASATSDQLAVSQVVGGEMLPAYGNYFFLVDGEDSVLMRKCDRSIVARIPNRSVAHVEHHTDWIKSVPRGLLMAEGTITE